MIMQAGMILQSGQAAAPRLPWADSPRKPYLTFNDVHLWRAFLDHSYDSELEDLLAADEIKRAGQFHFHKDRIHFITARGLLRIILGRYLDVPPDKLRFCYNAYGKPALAPEFSARGLRFNISHSHDLVLYAVTAGREVGVDIEHIKAYAADDPLAGQFFSPRELVELRALPQGTQQQAFFNCWTRKEAYIKAVGKGLSIDLDDFDVSFRPGEPAALLRVSGDAQEAARWALREITPAAGYVGALAVEGHDWRLQCWQWQG